MGAIVLLDLEIHAFEGEADQVPGAFWLRPLCSPEERSDDAQVDRCRDAHVVIEGSPEVFSLSEDTGIARLRGRFGVEVPAEPGPELQAWRIVANPLRRSEAAADGG